MLDSLNPLFWFTGYLLWSTAAGLFGLWLLCLVLDYGWRSLRWLFGLPRGSSIWEEPRKAPSDATTAPEARFPSWAETDTAEAPVATPVAPNAAWAAGEVRMELPTAKEAQ